MFKIQQQRRTKETGHAVVALSWPGMQRENRVDDRSLVSELERVLEPARRCLAIYARRQVVGVFVPPKPDINDLTVSLAPILNGHSVFGTNKDRFFGGKQLMLQSVWVAQNLLRVAAERGAALAVEWLHKVYSTEVADLRLVSEVHGLELEQPCALSNDVVLMPLASLPSSPNANALASQYQWPWRGLPSSLSTPIVAVLELRNVQGSQVPDPLTEIRATEVARSVMAFTLAKEAAPVVGNSWIDYVDPDLTLAEFGRMWRGANFEGVLGRVPLLKIDSEDVHWVERYLHLKPELRPLCDLAIDRLNLARRRHSSGDKAIEGGICLEALLGDGDPMEVTYKLTLRAALLLGSNLEERQRLKHDARNFYRLRSKTVHGRVPSAEEAQNDASCAAKGLDICAKVLRKIVEINEKPAPAIWELLGGPGPARTP